MLDGVDKVVDEEMATGNEVVLDKVSRRGRWTVYSMVGRFVGSGSSARRREATTVDYLEEDLVRDAHNDVVVDAVTDVV